MGREICWKPFQSTKTLTIIIPINQKKQGNSQFWSKISKPFIIKPNHQNRKYLSLTHGLTQTELVNHGFQINDHSFSNANKHAKKMSCGAEIPKSKEKKNDKRDNIMMITSKKIQTKPQTGCTMGHRCGFSKITCQQWWKNSRLKAIFLSPSRPLAKQFRIISNN